MKKILFMVMLSLVASIYINAQRLSTQQFLVRKITFSSNDQIVPISGITVEINKAKFRSDKSGKFTANIPVAKDMGFNISNISAPGYIVTIPENISRKIYLSPNEYVIVLADINAVKAEKNRIAQNNKIALAKQEARLKKEVDKNQELIGKLEKQEAEYKRILEDLENAKGQLKSFNNTKAKIEEKIDSLSDNLSLVDYASLNIEERARIDKEKEGKWINEMVIKVISELENNLQTKHDVLLKDFEAYLREIATDYFAKFIRGNSPSAINYFIGDYEGYLRDKLNGTERKNDKILDRILDKIIEEDMDKILKIHVENYKKEWNVELPEATSENWDTPNIKSLEKVKEDFLYYAWFPDRTDTYNSMKPEWLEHQPFDVDFINTLKRVYLDYYIFCKNASDDFIKGLSSMTDDELTQFASTDNRIRLQFRTVDAIRHCFDENIDHPYYQFAMLLADISALESLEPIRSKYNKLVEKEADAKKTMKYESIDQKLSPISEEEHCTFIPTWESGKYLEDYKEEYDNLRLEYTEYTAFLYPIVMQFMNPIVKKYDCDEAIYVRKSSMEEDVQRYCVDVFRRHEDRLSHIPELKGSDHKCFDIVRAIIEIEKENIVSNHNQRIAKLKNDWEHNESVAIVELKKKFKNKFNSVDDIAIFLAIHNFVNEDFDWFSWYDSNVSKYFFRNGSAVSSIEIKNIVVEWDANSAKIKQYWGDSTRPILINIKLSPTSSSYTESLGSLTRTYTAIKK